MRAAVLSALACAAACGDPRVASPPAGRGQIAAPVISAEPAAIELGDVLAGGPSSPVAVTVYDLGSGALDVSDVTAPAGYSVTGATTFSIPPHGSQTFEVTCVPPQTGGSNNGTLTISSDDPQAATYPIPLTCNGVTSPIQIAPAPATVIAKIGDTQTVSVDVSDRAQMDATFTSASVVGGAFSVLAAPSAGTPLPADGTALTVALHFQPTAQGIANGVLTVVTSAGTRTVALDGLGTRPALAIAPATTIDAPPGTLDLGPVCVGATAAVTAVLTASDDAEVTVSAVAPPQAPFTLQPPGGLPVELDPYGAGELDLAVGVTLAAPGLASDALVLTTDIPGGSAYALPVAAFGIGSGVAATPEALDFGLVDLDEPSPALAVAITNCSGGDLSAMNARIAGPDAASFALATEPDGSDLGSNASLVWTVRMTPLRGGSPLAAELDVDTAAGTITVPLAGSAVVGVDAGPGEHNYYSCQAGGGGALPLGLALLALRRRQRGRA